MNLHAFRIFLRRLQADLELLEPLVRQRELKPLLNRVRRLLKNSSRDRDTEVVAELLANLKLPVMKGPVKLRLSGKSLGLLRQGLTRSLKNHKRRLGRALHGLGSGTSDIHRVRIHAKRLRYGLASAARILGEKPPSHIYHMAKEAQACAGHLRDLTLAAHSLKSRTDIKLAEQKKWLLVLKAMRKSALGRTRAAFADLAKALVKA